MLLLQVYDCVKQDNKYNYKAQQARWPDSRPVKAKGKLPIYYATTDRGKVLFNTVTKSDAN